MGLSIPESMRIDLEKKRLIFTITTGRSGTGYLARMLSLVPGVASYHEPKPKFSRVMRLVQQDVHIAYKFWVDEKLPRIMDIPAPTYVETSHLFCKGFVEPLLDLCIVPDMIILTRPHREVAASLFQLGTIPGRTELGLQYCLSPEDPGVLPLPAWRAWHDYQLCYWYCLEVERRSGEYERVFTERGACVVKASLGEIRTEPGFCRLLDQLDLPKLGVINRLIYSLNKNRRVNMKKRSKAPLALPEDVDSLEQEVLSVVRRSIE